MRKSFALLVATSLMLGAAGLAGAEPLNWSGTTTVIIGDIPPLEFSGGGVATVNNSSGGVPAHLATLRLKGSRGQIAGTETRFITDPYEIIQNGINMVVAQATHGTGTFAPISGGVQSTSVLTRNIMPVYGVARICLLSTVCSHYLDLPFTQPTTLNAAVGTGVYGIGIGGLITAGGYGGIRISVEAAPWTIKTTTVTDQITTTGLSRTFIDVTAKGWAHAPASTTSNTAQPSGVVQLVTPAQVITNLPAGSYDRVGGLAIMVIHFIPEPGLLLLLGSGVIGLVLLGRGRRTS
jgi:hypothetical protein